MVIVGAEWNDTGGTNSGRAYLFDVTTGALITTLANPSPRMEAGFGISVAIADNLAVVGSYSFRIIRPLLTVRRSCSM